MKLKVVKENEEKQQTTHRAVPAMNWQLTGQISNSEKGVKKPRKMDEKLTTGFDIYTYNSKASETRVEVYQIRR